MRRLAGVALALDMRRRLAGVALALLTVPAQAFEPDFRASYTNLTTALRHHLLSGYDKVVPPQSHRTEWNNYSEAGTDVQIEVRFFKIETVETATARLRFKIWYRLYWQDLRLSWNPEEWGGVTKTFFQADAVTNTELTEIWLPDVKPYNTADGIENTLEPALARVESDGRVFWSRPGILDVLCRFSGLVAFPFDSVTCPVEFGGWALSGGYQGISLHNEGWSYGQQEVTSGGSYQEHTIDNVTVKHQLLFYESFSVRVRSTPGVSKSSHQHRPAPPPPLSCSSSARCCCCC